MRHVSKKLLYTLTLPLHVLLSIWVYSTLFKLLCFVSTYFMCLSLTIAVKLMLGTFLKLSHRPNCKSFAGPFWSGSRWRYEYGITPLNCYLWKMRKEILRVNRENIKKRRSFYLHTPQHTNTRNAFLYARCRANGCNVSSSVSFLTFL